jgi:putative sugar O-methyltransferase
MKKIVFLIPGTEIRPKILNGDTIRYGGAPSSGTDQSVIMVAEYLAKNNYDVTIVLENTDKKQCRGVKYTAFDYEGLVDSEVDFLVSCLWFTDYDKIPFKVTTGLIYWYHMAWAYGIYEMIQYVNKYNLKFSCVNISNWSYNQTKEIILNNFTKETQFHKSVIIPNPIMTDLMDNSINKNLTRKKNSCIFHAQWSRGGVVAQNVLDELGWEKMYSVDYTNHKNSIDKQALFDKMVQHDYFIFPLYDGSSCLYKDTFSCAVAEAIAAGVIVITYPLGAIPEYFSDGCVFIEFPPETDMTRMIEERVSCDIPYMSYTENIKNILLHLDNHPEEKQQLRDKAKNLIKDNFSIDIIGKHWTNLLESYHENTLEISNTLDVVKKEYPSSITDTEQYAEYRNICKNSEHDNNIFSTFRQNHEYKKVLEHVTIDAARDYYIPYIMDSFLMTPKFMSKLLDGIRSNDVIGNPELYNFGGLIGLVSPSSLRYAKVLTELVELFGSLDNKNIIEIGAGYGGQCVLINKIFNVASYTIVDLVEVLPLTKRYLKECNINNVNFYEASTNKKYEQKYDIVISNFAISECTREYQMYYINNILNNSKHGYICYNEISSIYNIDSLNSYDFKQVFSCKEKEYNSGSTKLLYW